MAQLKRCYGWGLIGPGRFAREFAEELGTVERARSVAVASRSEEKARHFADEFGFDKAYGDYQSLIDDSEVDIVYVVVPHVFHREIAEMAITAGKAVLCEKPLTSSYEDSLALTSFAKEKGVFLMEAMKTGFLPAILAARYLIESGAIGEVRLAKADFCFTGPTDPDDRLMNPELAGGAVLDVGIYPLYLARFLLGHIREVSAYGTLAETGVEDSAAIVTAHESGAAAVSTCSFRTTEQMGATVLGTEGEIYLPKFHAATEVVLKRKGDELERKTFPESGMVKAEIEAVMESMDRGLIENPVHSHRDCTELARIMDEVRDQLGAKRPSRQ